MLTVASETRKAEETANGVAGARTNNRATAQRRDLGEQSIPGEAGRGVTNRRLL